MHLTAETAIPRNDEEAARWLYLAATQGHRDAYLQLGYRYHRGLGVRRNDKKAAYMVSHRCVSRGPPRHGRSRSGTLLDEASRRTGPRQLRGGNRPDLLQAGPLFASRFLGDAYVCGLGIAQSYEEDGTRNRSKKAT